MKHPFDHQNQQITRYFRYLRIIALIALLSPMTVWAHTCGPRKLTVEKGNTIVYSIKGHGVVTQTGHKIVDKGDPLVAMIEPPVGIDHVDLEFKITGTGDGTTKFRVRWIGQNRQGICSFKVTVSG